MRICNISACLILIVAALFGLQCKTQGKREYVVTPSTVPFSISRNEVFETLFYVKNLGTENLHISEVATACGCVVGTLKDSTVSPMDSVPVRVVFTPRSVDTGEIVRFITIRANGIPPIRSVQLKGDVH